MNNAEIRWTSEAIAWLKDIHDYIAIDSSSAAASVIDGIFEKASLLKSFPDAGYKYRTEKEGDIRILLYGHYRIVYIVKSIEYIDIIGVFHGTLDIDKYLL